MNQLVSWTPLTSSVPSDVSPYKFVSPALFGTFAFSSPSMMFPSIRASSSTLFSSLAPFKMFAFSSQSCSSTDVLAACDRQTDRLLSLIMCN